jgi:acyl-CoA thioester hydrolase
MKDIFFEGKVMWSQIDANMHLRHSAYADFAAQARLELLEKMNFGADVLTELKIGPILFREELIYMREVRPNDTVKVSCELSKCRTDGARWSFVQKIYRSDNIQAALINVDGAWIDIQHRKLTALPPDIVQQFLKLPKTADFELTEPTIK